MFQAVEISSPCSTAMTHESVVAAPMSTFPKLSVLMYLIILELQILECVVYSVILLEIFIFPDWNSEEKNQ